MKLLKVRIAGLGCMSDEEKCHLTGNKPTGYIELDYEMIPCDLNILGPGKLGDYVTVPKEYDGKVLELMNLD